jgi:IS30 family transposase
MKPTSGQAAKLTGKEDLIREHLDKKIPQSVIARLLNVHRLTVRNDMARSKSDEDPILFTPVENESERVMV